MKQILQEKSLPAFFKPILWSYDFAKINPKDDQKLIITQAINYGNLKHWRWISRYYGKKMVAKILSSLPVSEVRPQAIRLASTLFPLKGLSYARRDSRTK